MYLGIDLGTSGVKAALIGDDGGVVADASAPLTVQRPHSGWSEQNPADWWDAVDKAVGALSAADRAAVRAIGLSGQMHGAVLLDESHAVLRPAILWNDGRSAPQCRELEAAVPTSREITGNLAMPGFTAPKLQWVREHEPEVFAATRTVLLPKDYLRLRMTGDLASDMSDSAGTLWLDVAQRAWSDEMLEACGLSAAHMPALFEGSEVTGTLSADVAARWGMERVPVVAGAGDNAAGAIGVGVTAPGNALLSLGTSGVTFVATDGFRPNVEGAVHTFCHALPGVWHQMAVHLSAASCIDWAMRQLGIGSPSDFFALAQQVEPGSGPEIFMPYLSGERTPHNDPSLRAGWLYCDDTTTPARLAAAVLEGVAFTFADGIDALRAAGSPVSEAIAIGGGSRSRHWGEIIAGATGTQLSFCSGGDIGPALGAARLARMGATGEDAAVVCTAPPIEDTARVEAAMAERLEPKLHQFRRATRALAETTKGMP